MFAQRIIQVNPQFPGLFVVLDLEHYIYHQIRWCFHLHIRFSQQLLQMNPFRQLQISHHLFRPLLVHFLQAFLPYCQLLLLFLLELFPQMVFLLTFDKLLGSTDLKVRLKLKKSFFTIHTLLLHSIFYHYRITYFFSIVNDYQ